MDGFKRPSKHQRPVRPSPGSVPVPPQALPPVTSSQPALPPVSPESPEQATPPSNPNPKRIRIFLAIGLFLVLLAAAVGAYMWYQRQLLPVDTSDNSVQRVEIKEGTTFSYVAKRLEERGVIRNSLVFRLYAVLHGRQGDLKAGACSLTPADSASQILDKITTGCHDFKVVTFYPGATLESSLYARTKAAENKKEFKDLSIRASLKAAGFSDNEVTNAFMASYDSPLFAGKPSTEGYEGYIFGETYYVDVDATAKEVLEAAFEHMYTIVTKEQLVDKFKANGLSLYQGITLASIVERELDCEGKPTEERQARCYEYQQRIARVFYNRLENGMSLGSDVTSIYASDKQQATSSVGIDSPYNTRKYTGLTPGPIATPGQLALRAVANPSDGDDLYFLAGDDGLIYFAKDEAGHRANIANHCKISCGSL